MKKGEFKKYYLSGFIVLIVGLVLTIFGATLPLINQDLTYLGWIGLAICVIGLLLLFLGSYLFKKGNYKRLNAEIQKSREDFDKDLKKIMKRWEETENKDDKDETIDVDFSDKNESEH